REIDQRPTRWIIDFGTMTREEAAAFKGAFRYLQRHVYGRKQGEEDRKTEAEKARWWQFVRPRPEMRASIADRSHVLVLTRVSPPLIVTRHESNVCFDGQLMVIALDQHYHFGILQSRLHETWAWTRGSTLEERLRYTNTTVFETFPFPLRPDGDYRPRGVP